MLGSNLKEGTLKTKLKYSLKKLLIQEFLECSYSNHHDYFTYEETEMGRLVNMAQKFSTSGQISATSYGRRLDTGNCLWAEFSLQLLY